MVKADAGQLNDLNTQINSDSGWMLENAPAIGKLG